MVVDYLSSQPNRAGYQVSTKKGSGPSPIKANQQTGQPALYDNAIPDAYEHNLGIQKGWAGT